jgi:hypothetical protein
MNSERNLTFDIHNLTIHGFRMQIFFVVAGFFARLVFIRAGAWPFLKQRLQRIGLPLVLGAILIVPACWVIVAWGLTRNFSTAIQAMKSNFLINLMHLWFLYYLMLFYLVVIAIQAIARHFPFQKSLLEKLDRIFRGAVHSPFRTLLFALTTLPIYYFANSWGDIGLPVSIKLIPRVFFYYAVFFAAGWWLHRNLGIIDGFRKFVWSSGALAIITLISLILLLPHESKTADPNYRWLKLGALLATNLYTWSAIFLLFGVFLRVFDRPSERVRYYADASYWFYLAHLPIVFWLNVLILPFHLNPFLGFGLVTSTSFLLLLLSYEYGVRYTFIGRTLNGPRERTKAGVNVREPELAVR